MHLAESLMEELNYCIDLSPQGRLEGCAMKTKAILASFLGVLFITLIGYAPEISARVSVNIGIGVPLPQVVIPVPPRVVIHEPPPVVVIPGTYVYFAPDAGVDIFFYHGYWYRPHRGYWYRARGYNGPWDNIEGARVPHVVRDLPPDFRHTVRHQDRIRHVDLQRNWKTWEHEKHWEKRDYRQLDRHDVRGGHDGARWEGSHGRPDNRHDVRAVRDDRRSGGDQLRLGGGRPEVGEVRNDHTRGKQENEQGKPEGRGKHDR
jgi:hypothetical protein